MEFEIKITDLEEAIEKSENDGKTFNSFEEELQYVNQKYHDKYIQYCADVEREWLDSDEYIPDGADIFSHIKAEFCHFKNLIKKLFKGECIHQESLQWVTPYDSVRDTIQLDIHIPIKEWNRLKKKWKV